MPLTNTEIRNAKPRSKPYKLTDEKGLFLLITPSGGKWWRLKYRFGGKEKLLSLGVFPDVGAKYARERRDEARKLLAQGIDPSQHRKLQKRAKQDRAANSFETVAREWFAKHVPGWAPGHSSKIIQRFERDVFPWLGDRPIAEIAAPELLIVLRRIEARGALDTAHRAFQTCGQVFRYAVATGRAMRDPTADLRGALPPVKGKHFAAITEPAELGALLRAINGFNGTLVVKCALRLIPMVFVRPGELRQAEWVEFDFDHAEWNIPAEKTKLRRPHLVPLSSQAVAILRELYPLTGGGCYVFPGGRDAKRPMSDAALNAALRRMGFTQAEVTIHGFRATARTLLHEKLNFDPNVIEHQLAHRVSDPLGAAYNRTKFIRERRKMMQAWANYLDNLTKGGKILPGRFGKTA
jgi:integrase